MPPPEAPPPESPSAAAPLRVEPVSPARADALMAFFREHSRGCYCRWWHYDGDDLSWQGRCTVEPEQNAREAAAALREADLRAAGVVAIEGDGLGGERVVGWLKLSPSPEVGKLYRRRVYRTLSCFDGDRARTWVIGCMLVHPERRREGLGRALVRGAIAMAEARGGVAVEATPRRPRDPVAREHEIWMGPAALFDELGFTRIDDGPDAYPVYRFTL